MENEKQKEQQKMPFLTCRDHTVSGQEFELHYNPKMDLLETFPKPDLEQLPSFYKSEKYISHTDSASGILDKIYQGAKSFMLDKKISWIENEKGKKGKPVSYTHLTLPTIYSV